MACRKRHLKTPEPKSTSKQPRFSTKPDVSHSQASAQSLQPDNKNQSSFLQGLHFYILPACIEKTRLNIFKNQVLNFGGKIYDDFASSFITHIIVEDKMDIARIQRIMQVESLPATTIVKSAWLSSCLRNKAVESIEKYVIHQSCKESSRGNQEKNNESDVSKEVRLHSLVKNNSGSDSEYSASDEDIVVSNTQKATTFSSPRNIPVDKWICAQSSKNVKPNFNQDIVDKLEEMASTYQSTNDKWRAFGYQKAIQALRRHPNRISSWEEAKSLTGVGTRLADKIWEIAESGQLRKLKEFESSDEVTVMKLFTNVWGAGPHSAKIWYQQGFRTIDDLRQKANLTHQQEVGVRLYDDLLDRMPREEAAEIEKIVRTAAEEIKEGIIAQACGSYRRGKLDCGDVDVLITHPDGKSHKGIFQPLLTRLKETGFITDDLVSVEESGNQKKYLGVCKLPGPNQKHRRLDIIVVPYSEYGCALVYFTGSAHFNRSLRHLCKTQHMSLNEHALKAGVVRKGAEKLFEGTIIPTPSEKSVFEALKIPYRPPEERDH
ncbi:DNA polymerase lambda-like [Physella acuta]|uniref:DNA polymerase lambda-like n=1 Tax=Physella acuta TaxID=109671 RepID=UPI0027DC1628|nr:DNA polymerase lambda-like [Physella acuta]XP_059160057.1 DNA polymerase lambda-like [Physella acuta]